ncbi:MAG: cytochrome-c peroxidase [Bryobacteraceae bacterium]
MDLQASSGGSDNSGPGNIDSQLATILNRLKFTGRMESTLEQRLGRKIDPKLAKVGQMLWFDTVTGLHDDNTCAGCHAPAFGFGDSQSIAIGIQSNSIVGQDRSGPFNQRRSPKAINVAFYPALMWNGRFSAPSGDPFDNSQGFLFPAPEGSLRFPPGDPIIKHLAQAQGHMPPTETTEVAGFTGTKNTPFSLGPRFDIFDDGKGSPLPPPDQSGYRNDPIRKVVLERLNSIPAYRQLFGDAFPEVSAGAPIDFSMFGRAIAEFEFTLTFADAPIDEFAQGNRSAMSDSEKRGALLFFGAANCVSCHAVSGQSNEMFSDFHEHNIAVPQIAPVYGVGKGNVIFDGPNEDEDFGLEQVTGNPADRYRFRTAPLRNVAVQPAFFHNGSFTKLEDAVRHHLNAYNSALTYNPALAGVRQELSQRTASMSPVLTSVDPLLRPTRKLSEEEINDLIQFVRTGLLDKRVNAKELCGLIPSSVPSGRALLNDVSCSSLSR